MKRVLFSLALLISSLHAGAQAPEQFNYQAVVRDGSGNLIKNQTVTVKIGIYDGGSLSYEETHSVNTDAYGLLNLQVGNGTATSGTFSNLDWANTQYQVKVEVDNGNGFQNLGQQSLSSVPYALHAASAPAAALDELTDVNAASPSANQVLQYDGNNWVPGTSGPSYSGGTGISISGSNSINADLGTDIATGELQNQAVSTAKLDDDAVTAPKIDDMGASSGEVLEWNGSQWAPAASSSAVWNTSGSAAYYNSGKVGIGTSTPNEKLDVQGNAAISDSLILGTRKIYPKAFGVAVNGDLLPDPPPSFTQGVYLGNSSNYWNRTYTQDLYVNEIKDGPASSNFLEIDLDTIKFGSLERIYDAGSFAIGFNSDLAPGSDDTYDLGSSSDRWDDVYATNGTIQTSDRRSKKDITNLDYGLEEVMAIRPVTFRWKDKPQEKKKIGVIAQQIQPILNEVVKTHDWQRSEDGQLQKVKNERLGVYYSDMIPVLIKAIQEQQSIMEQQQSKIQKLEKENQELQSLQERVEALEQQMETND